MSVQGKTASGDWTKVSERGSVLGLQFMIFIFRVLGRQVCLLLLFPVTAYFFLTGKQARHASREFLERIYCYSKANQLGPLSTLQRLPGATQSFIHFYEFGRAVVDRTALWIGGSKFELLWEREHRELYLELLESNKGVVLFGAHLGNVEVLRALSQERHGIRVNALMYTGHATRFNSVIRKLNPNSGLRLIPLEAISASTAIMLNERLASGEFVSMLADRVAAGAPDRVLRLPFLGKEAAFPQGPFILASLLQAPVYFIFALREGDARYRIHFERFSDQIVLPRKERELALRALMERFVSRLEHYCAIAPYQWFNFYDFWSVTQDKAVRDGAAVLDRLPLATKDDLTVER